MSEFRKAAKQENELFDEAVRKVSSLRRRNSLAAKFAKAAEAHVAAVLWEFEDWIQYRPNLEGGGGFLWRFKRSSAKSWREAADIDVGLLDGERVFVYTEETGKGEQAYHTEALSASGKSLWKSTVEIGSDIAIIGETIYALEVDTPLRYNRLIQLDLRTGKKVGTLFTNKDDRWTLALICGTAESLFLIREQAGSQECYEILHGTGLRRLHPKGVCFHPLGRGLNGDALVLVRFGAFSSPWKLIGGSEFETTDGIEFATGLPGQEILITRNFGERTLWTRKAGGGKFIPRRNFFGMVLADPLESWKGIGTSRLWIVEPGSTISCISLNGRTVVRGEEYAKVKDGVAISRDGLPVRWLCAASAVKPKGLVVISYGAYGLATPLGTARWRPWLDAGWAIGFALVRGGGDGNEVWASMGRLSGKEAGIDDLEAVIQNIQETLNISAKDTIVFGRSAGGLMVGGIAGRHPNGDVAASIYAEVPYVDLLKTAANPSLPLTPSEYLEFGNPRKGAAEFEQTLRSSPVHRLPSDGAPGLRVVCRTGIFDLQVYPYESLKWILALRGPTPMPGLSKKYLHVGMEGHFTQGRTKYTDMAEDFLLLQ